MRYLLFFFFAVCSLKSLGQSYADTIYQHREHYKQEFLNDPRSPLKAADTSLLCFFVPDMHYRVKATLTVTPSTPTFQIATHSGKTKTYRQYAIAVFSLKGKEYSLRIYQSIDLIKKEAYRNHLFLPFNDLTNYEETYGGGRYIDLSTDEIKDGTIIIDFNRCYNPYCAFGSGYSCPIPPEENKLQVRIEAGEKKYAGVVKE